jgi:hypothetical protein
MRKKKVILSTADGIIVFFTKIRETSMSFALALALASASA